MANLYHLKNDHENEKIGELIVDLDKVQQMIAVQIGNEYCLRLSQIQDNACAWFKDRSNFLATFKEIINKMGGDPEMADNYTLQIRSKDKRDSLLEALEKIASE